MEAEPSVSLTRALSINSARAAARSLTADERDALREAGRRKLDQYRQLKHKCRNGDIDDIITGAGFGVRAFGISAEDSKRLKEQDVAEKSKDARRSDQAASEGLSAADPMIDCLLAQVNNLMQERQALQAVADQLRRENEQLHELVGYLSLQQSLLSSSEDGEGEEELFEEHASTLPTVAEVEEELQVIGSASSSGGSEASHAMVT